jgi:uncharacterized protein Veg
VYLSLLFQDTLGSEVNLNEVKRRRKKNMGTLNGLTAEEEENKSKENENGITLLYSSLFVILLFYASLNEIMN